jgi:hypothetical protein
MRQQAVRNTFFRHLSFFGACHRAMTTVTFPVQSTTEATSDMRWSWLVGQKNGSP